MTINGCSNAIEAQRKKRARNFKVVEQKEPKDITGIFFFVVIVSIAGLFGSGVLFTLAVTQ